jgi:hypothetical protein
MSSKDDYATAHIAKLPPELRSFAWAEWIYRRDGGPRPLAEDYGLTAKEAEKAVIHMAMFGR